LLTPETMVYEPGETEAGAVRLSVVEALAPEPMLRSPEATAIQPDGTVTA
jgi:hypothetical protein